MHAIQAHFQSLGREPTDIELETLAQTWSEHCSHKTLKGRVELKCNSTTDGTDKTDKTESILSVPPVLSVVELRKTSADRIYDNLLKETIFGATQEIRRRLGADDWCVSVFEDNAGVVRFDDEYQRLLQGRNAQSSLGHRAVRRSQHRPGRRHPRSARHRPGSQADLQHRCLLLRSARHAAGRSSRRSAASAQGDAGRRGRRARLRQSHGHSDRQRGRVLRSALSRQSARLLRHGRPDSRGRCAASRSSPAI